MSAGTSFRAGGAGRQWRGLEELEGRPDIAARLRAEFPPPADRSEWARRDVVGLLGAALALAGLSGCSTSPDERALPYVDQPEFALPGQARLYATAVTLNGYAQPVLGETHDGRPTKLEGNPDHPASRGATDAFTQAAVLGLYDPDRSRVPRWLGRPTDWAAFDRALVAEARRLDGRGGDGFRLLTGQVTSPTFARQLAALAARWPGARWHAFEPIGEERRLEAARLLFGRPFDLLPRLDAAEVVVSLDDDLLGPGPRQTLQARLWSTRRLEAQAGRGESLLFCAEASPTPTGVVASRRLPVAPGRIGALASGLATALGVGHAGPPELTEAERSWVAAAAGALERLPGRGLVIAGARQPAEVQALALLVTERAGGLGRTVELRDPVALAPPDGPSSLGALVRDIEAGRVGTLAVIEANPVQAAPPDLAFARGMDAVPLRIHAGLHADETAALCHWHAPLLHDLDGWSDARSVDGRTTIMQPLVRPFVDGRSRHVVLQNLLGDLCGSDHELVRETWRARWGDDFADRWTEALTRGFVEGEVAACVPPPRTGPIEAEMPPAQRRGLGVEWRPDPTVWDGRFANLAWLQELPDPAGKVTWDNVVAIAPALAAERGLETGDEVRLTLGERSATGPVYVLPGQEARTVTLALGYGRRGIGRVADGVGFDASALRSSERPWFDEGLELAATGRRLPLATTQMHHALGGHDFVRTLERAAAPAGPLERTRPGEARAPSLYPVRAVDAPSWGMSIDLDLCIGCNACVVACVAENNIPTVGKEQVAKGRAMHWLRVDRYHEGKADDPRMFFQPVPCMHCEAAPCEMGCPVNATTHSPDGLNQQVYNRCIGTRTCSSYCPYKVRRFNWFDFTAHDPPEIQAVRNPDVTVRSRGVMEKCTYCVQRISGARIAAKKEGRAIRDGEVVTACQQACPTSAIVFGDVTDPTTAVSRRKASGRDYTLLEEVNTRPRTTYLARIDDGAGGGPIR